MIHGDRRKVCEFKARRRLENHRRCMVRGGLRPIVGRVVLRASWAAHFGLCSGVNVCTDPAQQILRST